MCSTCHTLSGDTGLRCSAEGRHSLVNRANTAAADLGALRPAAWVCAHTPGDEMNCNCRVRSDGTDHLQRDSDLTKTVHFVEFHLHEAASSTQATISILYRRLQPLVLTSCTALKSMILVRSEFCDIQCPSTPAEMHSCSPPRSGTRKMGCIQMCILRQSIEAEDKRAGCPGPNREFRELGVLCKATVPRRTGH